VTNADKNIVVTGATGQQGGATVRHLLADGWKVRAITRNPASSAAQVLARDGAEVIAADMEDRAALEAAMSGAYGVFSVQPSEFSPGSTPPGFGYDDEVRLGRNVADAAKASGILHFVYASVAGVERLHGTRNYSKWEIEQHIRTLGLKWTMLRPVWFMDNWAQPLFGIQSGTLTTALKPDVDLQMIAADDIGAFASLVFAHPDSYVGKIFEVAGDARSALQIATAISQAIGRAIPYVQIPMNVLGQQSATAARTFEVLNEEGPNVDIAALGKLYPNLMDFGTWLQGTVSRCAAS
jgi:uncharacterized protein YbjT (DUF2867 family)